MHSLRFRVKGFGLRASRCKGYNRCEGCLGFRILGFTFVVCQVYRVYRR